MQKSIILLSLLFIPFSYIRAEKPEDTTNKGRMYFYWGWNRSWYSRSDIHFEGENYKFKLNDMKAHDRQTPFGVAPYFNPSQISIPQTEMRLGFFVSDKIDISIGVDHMKYVLSYYQPTKIDGYINIGSPYDGIYSNDNFINSYSFLKFEHTDGLNYINVEITRHDDVLDLLNLKVNKKFIRLNSLLGFGLGPVLPKSNVNLLNKGRHDEFHWAGYGFSGKTGVDLILFKYFFVRSEYKVGFIDMPDIRTSSNPNDRASQHFFFHEATLNIGITYNFFN